MIAVDCDADADWDADSPADGWAAHAMRACDAALTAAGLGVLLAPDVLAEVSLVLTGDDAVRALNSEWRGKDRTTNVLSFPLADAGAIASPPTDRPLMLGDIVLAYGVCAGEAAERGVGTVDHATHLIIHGLLHLVGLDHETGDAAADAMEAVERRALAALGLHDPYPHHQEV